MNKNTFLSLSMFSLMACGPSARQGASVVQNQTAGLPADSATSGATDATPANGGTAVPAPGQGGDANVAVNPNAITGSDANTTSDANFATGPNNATGTNPNHAAEPNNAVDANALTINANRLILTCTNVPPCLALGEPSNGLIARAGVVVDPTSDPNHPLQIQAVLWRDKDATAVFRAAADNGLVVALPAIAPLPSAPGAAVDTYSVYAWNPDEVGADYAPVVRYASLKNLITLGREDDVVSWVKVRDGRGVLMGVAAKIDFSRMAIAANPPSQVGQGRRNSFSVQLCDLPNVGAGPGSSGLYSTPTAMIISDLATGEHVFTDIYADDGYRTSDATCSGGIFASNIMELGHTYSIKLYAQNGINAYLATSGADDAYLAVFMQQAESDVLLDSQAGYGGAFTPFYTP